MQPFSDEIWIADGPIVAVAGFRYPTRMVVIRLPGGALFVCSPIALTAELRIAIDALGTVRHVIAPNHLHHLFIAAWRDAYPEAKLYAPPGLRQRRPDVAFDGDLDDRPVTDWADEIDQVAVGGNWLTTEIVFFHRRSGTAVFTDLLQYFPPGWFTGWRGWVARMDLLVAPEPRVPRKFRLTFVDRRVARQALRRILSWPVERILMAHSAPVEKDGHAALVRAFAWLMR